VVGFSASAIFAPLMACVTGWFDTHRSLAVSLVSAGMGMAPMTMSPLVAWLVQGHDWRSTLQIVAAIVAALMVPAALLIRRPPQLQQAASADAAAVAPASAGQVLRSPAFLILTLMSFLSCATHSGPIFHTVSYAVTCGIPLMVAVSIYSLEGVSGMVGRLVFGLLGDRFGAARVLTLALLAQAVVYGFDQTIKVYDEGSTFEPNGDATKAGYHVKPHWRHGCFVNQPCGEGRRERKIIYRKPVFVNQHMFGGAMSATKVTMVRVPAGEESKLPDLKRGIPDADE
jgi:hypothetical protein